jgi:hypothetical protein
LSANNEKHCYLIYGKYLIKIFSGGFHFISIRGRATVYLVEELERGNIELRTKDPLID